MRIVIDLQGAQTGSRHRGIGRYSLALTQEIIRQRGDDDVLVALNGLFPDTIEPIRAALDGLLPQDRILVWDAFGPVHWCEPDNDNRRHLAEAIREAFLASLMPDIVLVTSLIEGAGDEAVGTIGRYFKLPTAAILYDLIPLIHEAIYLGAPEPKGWYFDKLDNLKNADMLLAISASSATEAVRYAGYPHDQITNISTASDGSFYPRPLSDADRDTLATKFDITRPYLLYTSATDERKNHVRLMAAYASLPEAVRGSHQLVFGGGLPDEHRQRFRAHAADVGLSDDELIITGRLTDDEMLTLYNGCKAFVFPSWHEGFGLPALEAMQCGKAVIASNASSLPEVVGLKDALFDPYDTQSIATRINEVLTDDTFRLRLERHGLVQSATFSWADSAGRALRAMRAWVGRSTPRRRIVPEAIVSEWALSTVSERLGSWDQPMPVATTDLAAVLAVNFPPAERRTQLLVDVSELIRHDLQSGIQRVVKSVLQEWLAACPDGWTIEPVYATPNAPGYFYARSVKETLFGLPARSADDDAVEAFRGDVFVGLDLQHYVVVAQADLLATWRRRGVTIAFVIYDLLPVTMPAYFPDWAPAMHRTWLEIATRFDRVFCISNAVAVEVGNWVDSNAPPRDRRLRIDWFHLGGDVGGEDVGGEVVGQTSHDGTLPDDWRSILDSIQGSPTFLMVGTIEPRKGHAQTLAAFERLWSEGHDVSLVIVGKPGWRMTAFADDIRRHPENGSRLLWFDRASDAFLREIYRASACLIAASEGEGFGLPLIEAARHGLPIIARDLPVFREVAGDNAFYFDDEVEPEILFECVMDWLDRFQRSEHPTSQHMQWLTWRESAARLLSMVIDDFPAQTHAPKSEESNKTHGVVTRFGTKSS